jgi:hypothetical protein
MSRAVKDRRLGNEATPGIPTDTTIPYPTPSVSKKLPDFSRMYL